MSKVLLRLACYSALTLMIGLVSDLVVNMVVNHVVGTDVINMVLANQLHWCMGENGIGLHLVSEDQADQIYGHWTGQHTVMTPWAWVFSFILRLTTFMAAAAQVNGLAAFIVLGTVLGIFGLVVFIRTQVLFSPFAGKQGPSTSEDLLAVLDHPRKSSRRE